MKYCINFIYKETITSKLNIQLENGNIIMEHFIENSIIHEEDYCLFLTYSSIETKKLMKYFRVQNGGEEFFINSILERFDTYKSLLEFRNFFERHNIYGTISESLLID